MHIQSNTYDVHHTLYIICISTDEHRKKEVRITLLSEDISKLRYETTYIDELSQREPFSFDRFVRRFRQIKLTKHVRFDDLSCGDVIMM